MRRDLHLITERVARIEGALTGPWLPTQRLAGAGHSKDALGRPPTRGSFAVVTLGEMTHGHFVNAVRVMSPS